jgi:predicted small lipoprotein YifL
MRIKYLIILIVSVLILNACGVKGPVKPVKKKPGKTIQTDSEADQNPESCGNKTTN